MTGVDTGSREELMSMMQNRCGAEETQKADTEQTEKQKTQKTQYNHTHNLNKKSQ